MKFTGAVKFAESVTVIVAVPDWPGCEIAAAVAVREKSSAPTAKAGEAD